MFYDRFSALCEAKGVSVTKAITEIGLSKGIGTKWKKTGATPNGKTLALIAAYFGVPVDYLTMGDVPGAVQKAMRSLGYPDPMDEVRNIYADPWTYAMHGYSGDLTDEDKATIESLAAKLAEANRKRGADGSKTE